MVDLEKELAKQQEKLKELKSCLIKQEVDEHDIALVLARWTKIPAEKLQQSETDKLLQDPKTPIDKKINMMYERTVKAVKDLG